MQRVSDEWKELQKENFIPAAYVSINISLVESAVINHTVLIQTNGEWNYEEENSGVFNFQKMTSKVESSDDGEFEYPPTLEASTYGYESTIPGITIVWNKEEDSYATDFVVRVYESSEYDPIEGGDTEGVNLLLQKEIHNNHSVLNYVSMNIEPTECYIEIDVLGWSKPGEKAVITNFAFGFDTVYQKDDIIDFTYESNADPICSEATESEITFSIVDLEGYFNSYNDNGVSLNDIRQSRVVVRYGFHVGDKIEWINGGVFYVSSVELSENYISAKFTAKDALCFLTRQCDSVDFDGEDPVFANLNLYSLVDRILARSEIPAPPKQFVPSEYSPSGFAWITPASWVISDRLKYIQSDYLGTTENKVSSDLDITQYTALEVIQYAANSSGCVFFVDRRGQIHIEPFNPGVCDYCIDTNNSYKQPDSNADGVLRLVNVNDGAGIYPTNSAEISNSLTKSSEISIQAENPFIFYDYSANYIAKNMFRHLRNREVFSGEFRIDPRVDILDIVTVENKFTKKNIVLTSLKIQYNGGFRGEYEGRVVSTPRNLVVNGGFENGLDGWNLNGSYINTISTETINGKENHYINTAYAVQSYPSGVIYQEKPRYQTLPDLANHKFYVSMECRMSNFDYVKPALYLARRIIGSTEIDTYFEKILGKRLTTYNQFQKFETITDADSYEAIGFSPAESDDIPSGYSPQTNTRIGFDNIIFVDLTGIYGKGTEPEIEEIRRILQSPDELKELHSDDYYWYWKDVPTYTWLFAEE